MFTDVYGCLRMFTECGTQTVEQVPAVLLMPSVETIRHGCEAVAAERTARMPQA